MRSSTAGSACSAFEAARGMPSRMASNSISRLWICSSSASDSASCIALSISTTEAVVHSVSQSAERIRRSQLSPCFESGGSGSRGCPIDSEARRGERGPLRRRRRGAPPASRRTASGFLRRSCLITVSRGDTLKPRLELLDVDADLGADSERGQLRIVDQPVDRLWTHAQLCCRLRNGQVTPMWDKRGHASLRY